MTNRGLECQAVFPRCVFSVPLLRVTHGIERCLVAEVLLSDTGIPTALKADLSYHGTL